jgi:hypothetical protein
VRFNAPVGEDEIDLDSGFLIMPQALPVAAPSAAATGSELSSTTADGPGNESTLTLTPPPGSAAGAGGTSASNAETSQRSVEISFTAGRNQLFTAWNAVANLADLAGKVTVTVRADSPEGFDKNKLQNGVMEPLVEAGLID